METKFNGFNVVVNEASVKNNDLPSGEFKLKPQMQRKIDKIREGTYIVEVSVEIHNADDNPFPIDLVARVTGVFDIEGDNEEEIKTFLQNQGFQMVFPHLRSLVANMTANAMMPPIFLPIVYPSGFAD